MQAFTAASVLGMGHVCTHAVRHPKPANCLKHLFSESVLLCAVNCGILTKHTEIPAETQYTITETQ